MEESPIPLDELITNGAEKIDNLVKATTIIRSSSAILSMISSFALIWAIKRSRTSLTTTYNRLLLGMAMADILFSLSLAHFNFTAPSDGSYYVWNASGNQVTCSIQGSMTVAGATSSLLYSCSLNLYSLAVVKYRKPDRYIRSKVEPYLHGVPIAYALVLVITLLAKKNINDNNGGSCAAPVYRPPHCIGFEDGQTREGFDIPCGRGHDGAVLFSYVSGGITLFLLPLLVGTSLGMIYRSVWTQETNMNRYGASNFTASAQQSTASDVEERIGRSTFGARVRHTVHSIKRISTLNQNRSNSRVVLDRAIAYSVAYCLTWGFLIIGSCLDLANIEWPNALWYLNNFFNPLQGFFNFLIYMFPKVMKAKSSGDDDMTWFQAFNTAFWGGGTGQTAGRIRQPPNRTPPAPLEREEPLLPRDEPTTEQLRQEDVVNLGNESKGEDTIDTATADDVDDEYEKILAVNFGNQSKEEDTIDSATADAIDDEYEKFLTVLDAPSLFPASGSGQLS